MIQTLRRRFILIAMLSVFFVLGGIITSINVSNYHHILTDADRMLVALQENKDFFDRDNKEDKPGRNEPPKDQQEASQTPTSLMSTKGGKDEGKKEEPGKGLSPEASFTTRYFSVDLNNNGTVLALDVDRIAAVSADEAVDIACSLYKDQETKGFYNTYRYTAINTQTGVQYLFLDCTDQLHSYHSFLWISVAISVGGFLLVLVLVLFFSRLVTRPIADNYEKQKRFITDAGHELKTPLTIIDANTEVLEMMNGENEWTESIRNQVQRLSSLTGELVTLTRMDESQSRLRMSDFSLSDAVTEAAEPFITVAVAQDKQLSLQVENNLSYYGDETALRRLVSLLLDNAIKYSAPEGQITLTLKANGKRRCLTVENLPVTLPTEDPENWFERFYRSDASRNSETGGHGIGLATAKAIVTAHRGKISARVINQTTIQITAVL